MTSEQFEMVIRRAAELQARAADAGEEGMPEAEVIRIGRELGLSGQALNQALAEVKGAEATPHGFLDRWLGTPGVRTSRTVPIGADDLLRLLEEYLVQREYMTIVRRFPDRALYKRDDSVPATIGRATSQIFERTHPLKLGNIEVAVQPLEEGYSYITVSSELKDYRLGFAAGGILGGGGAGAVTAATLGIAVAPIAAVVGVPVLAAIAYGMHAGYAQLHSQTLTKLESLLDRLEHGEIRAAVARRSHR
ncbi:MAG TPA: hypothetical protein VFL93_12095 [Longimicrobiaceae bacterium]|nr:hypothetical protein [Longimicrobiaceae bacterium]